MAMRQGSKAWLFVCALLGLRPLMASVQPAWWQNGWPKQRVGSVAEAELLSQLAVLLMPDEEISELFRKFPSPEGWGGHYLEPDLTAYGVLKDENAALFVEYDGHWRHGEKEGVEMDERKNAALLAYAPPGSYVVRISHAESTSLDGRVLSAHVDQWHRGQKKLLEKALLDIKSQIQVELGEKLHPNLERRWQVKREDGALALSARASSFTQQAMEAAGGNSNGEIAAFLRSKSFQQADIDLLLGSISRRGISIGHTLEPLLEFLRNLGLSEAQVTKVVAGFPHILGYSIEQNLKPTVQWLLELGLSKAQVTKVIAGFPQILGYSIEQNLKPTVQWLVDLGLSKAQVAKAVAGSPRILGYSIEQNLKPTVQWLLDLGLPLPQVAKVVAGFPAILGYSIEQNLKPKVQWLLDLGLRMPQVAKVVAGFPAILGYSIEQNLKPTVQWLLDLGLSHAQVAKAVAGFPQILGCSIEQNLKPTVQWLLDVGLGKAELAKVVAGFPPILGCSIARNLQVKLRLLEAYLGRKDAAALVATWPRFASYSLQRLEERLRVLQAQEKLDKLVSAMTLDRETFHRRSGPK